MTIYTRKEDRIYTIGDTTAIANQSYSAVLLEQHRDQIVIVGIDKIKELSGILLEILKEHDALNNQEVNHV
jgi:hypothetical protein